MKTKLFKSLNTYTTCFRINVCANMPITFLCIPFHHNIFCLDEGILKIKRNSVHQKKWAILIVPHMSEAREYSHFHSFDLDTPWFGGFIQRRLQEEKTPLNDDFDKSHGFFRRRLLRELQPPASTAPTHQVV